MDSQPCSGAANLTFGQPFVHGSAWKPDEPARELAVRQAAREEIVHRADGHTEAGGELPFVFVVRRWRLACANFRNLISAHIASLAGEFIALRDGTMKLVFART
jgi:hypothetical protein